MNAPDSALILIHGPIPTGWEGFARLESVRLAPDVHLVLASGDRDRLHAWMARHQLTPILQPVNATAEEATHGPDS